MPEVTKGYVNNIKFHGSYHLKVISIFGSAIYVKMYNIIFR